MDVGILSSNKKCQLQPIVLPPLNPNQVRIKIHYAGVNRADLEQALGLYPPPQGASEILGLECSGIIEELGSHVQGFHEGDAVMALLTGGGFASRANVDSECLIKVPKPLNMAEAAVLPESLFTFWANAVMDGQLSAGNAFLVHGGASGLGSFSLQMAKTMGCRCFTTARGRDRIQFVKSLGCDEALDTEPFDKDQLMDALLKRFGQCSIDVIMDHLGADFLPVHLQLLKSQGRLIFINSVSGEKGLADLDLLIGKRLHLIGSVLRGRSLEEKDKIRKSIEKTALPIIQQKKLHPKVDSVLPLKEIEQAFERVDQRKNLGKVVLDCNLVN